MFDVSGKVKAVLNRSSDNSANSAKENSIMNTEQKIDALADQVNTLASLVERYVVGSEPTITQDDSQPQPQPQPQPDDLLSRVEDILSDLDSQPKGYHGNPARHNDRAIRRAVNKVSGNSIKYSQIDGFRAQDGGYNLDAFVAVAEALPRWQDKGESNPSQPAPSQPSPKLENRKGRSGIAFGGGVKVSGELASQPAPSQPSQPSQPDLWVDESRSDDLIALAENSEDHISLRAFKGDQMFRGKVVKHARFSGEYDVSFTRNNGDQMTVTLTFESFPYDLDADDLTIRGGVKGCLTAHVAGFLLWLIESEGSTEAGCDADRFSEAVANTLWPERDIRHALRGYRRSVQWLQPVAEAMAS